MAELLRHPPNDLPLMNWSSAVFATNLFLREDRWVVLVYSNKELIYRHLPENLFVAGDGWAVHTHPDVQFGEGEVDFGGPLFGTYSL